MKFTGFYSGHSVCAPSRCTLMTGKHTGHSAIRNNAQRAPGAEGQIPLPAGTVTTAQLLKQAGYATAIVGKWGLGMPEDKSSPLDFGFDHHYGYLCQSIAHTFYPPYLRRDNEKEMLDGNPAYDVTMKGAIEPGGKTYSADLIAADGQAGCASTRAGRSSSTSPPPCRISRCKCPPTRWPNTKGSSREGDAFHRHEALRELREPARHLRRHDHALRPRGGPSARPAEGAEARRKHARLFQQRQWRRLPALGDGPGCSSAAQPRLRGYKQDLYEGGIRTPYLARWPGHIEAGSTNDDVGAFWDMLPTFCELAGVAARPRGSMA